MRGFAEGHMDQASLRELIEVSRAVGERAELVQAGGGNTSVKRPDGRTMAIKASGTALADMTEHAGWVELDLDRLLALFDRPGLGRLPAPQRESRVLEQQEAAVLAGPGPRPSVESALHALLGRVVIHTHPVAVNALTCGPGESALSDLAEPDELPPLWVPYADPGYTLAVAVREAIETYRAEHDAPPAVLFLENHGLFVSAESAEASLALHGDWVGRCRAYFEATARPVQAAGPVDPARLRRLAAAVRGAYRRAGAGPVFTRVAGHPELAGAASDPDVGQTLAHGALSPDQIVYTGPYAIYAESARSVARALRAVSSEPSRPRVVLVKDFGTLLVSESAEDLDTIETVAACAAETIRLANGRGGAHNLTDEAAEFIIGWEAEHYRAGLLAGHDERLTGQVALVTGAASGLGLGIANGLLDAGAAVAFCDIDRPGLESALDNAPAPDRALPVDMDVTDEAGVCAGFDSVIGHWGGVDIVVCAAGIAPPYELVDFPVDPWRKALEINLTGYFLVAREGARTMKSQGDGGAMVLVSSKTGLEASKANSAYNATKAGELHLMRGWALELGGDGIRVNAVAPGNVFEGSKIWNPDYIKACAEKKGIRPEEVIPYYVNLTALKREITREDVAAAVVFLCSDKARCITGQTLVIDSGQVMTR
ncbi:MAG: SDR family oxidoreductase [Planctomycetota bacterium]